MPLIEDLGKNKFTGPGRFYSYARVGQSGSGDAFGPTAGGNINANSSGIGGSSSGDGGGNGSIARGKKRLAAAAAHARISDSASRQRAINKRLLELDRENYNEPASGSLSSSGGGAARDLDPGRRGSTPATRRILASRKTLTNLLDDDPAAARDTVLVLAAPPKYPLRLRLCSVCGFQSKYICARCGYRYCSLACDETHKETRCIKTYV
jgi:zinc finger HIT domain-containing protein 1